MRRDRRPSRAGSATSARRSPAGGRSTSSRSTPPRTPRSRRPSRCCEGVRYLPARARRKVYIIDEVHMLSSHSFNALLKTLEEPPPHVVFIFATTEVHKIPATILSRCQRFDFKLISTARLTDAPHRASSRPRRSPRRPRRCVSSRGRPPARCATDCRCWTRSIAYVGSEKLTAEIVADVLGIADRQLLVGLTTAALDRDPGERAPPHRAGGRSGRRPGAARARRSWGSCGIWRSSPR